MDLQNATMVVARYTENVDWLEKIPWDYIVYNKGPDNLPQWIKNEVKLPNSGREAHTYLTYIVDHYDQLPDYVIFVQGNPFTHTTDLLSKISTYTGEKDFISLTDRLLICNNRTFATRKSLESIQQIYSCHISSLKFSKGAQFIVSKQAIQFHSHATYQKLLEHLIRTGIQVHVITLEGRGYYELYKHPFSAWIIERLWNLLFDSIHKTVYD